jgi:hypothetical protein
MKMNDRVLVGISLPAAGLRYDVYLPVDCMMSEALVMVSGAFTELSRGMFSADASTVLCDADSGIIYNLDKTIGELGLRNGSKLLLI